MIELQDDEYEAMCTAITELQKQNSFYESQITKFDEILKSYEEKINKLSDIILKAPKNPSNPQKSFSMMTLDKDFKSIKN